MVPRPRLVWSLGLGLLALGLTGCGQGSALGEPKLPLATGARVVQQARRCDQGEHVYCGLYLVVVDRRFPSSKAFMTAERRRLGDRRWTLEQGAIGQEQSAVSPDRRFRLTYATAEGELRAVDLGWVQRPSVISQALARAIFERTPALELTVGAGPS